MNADKSKLTLAMARGCVNLDELAKASGVPRPTLNHVIGGRGTRPGTLGRIARALGVDVTEILAKEEQP